MHSSPQYFEKYSVVECARKYEKSKKRCTISNKVKIRKIREKRGKILKKPRRRLKKGHQNFLPPKCKFFPKETSSWSAKKFFRPPKLGARFPPLLAPLQNYVMLPNLETRHLWTSNLTTEPREPAVEQQITPTHGPDACP